jgi:alpha-D-xyloside xylohydrolase
VYRARVHSGQSLRALACVVALSSALSTLPSCGADAPSLPPDAVTIAGASARYAMTFRPDGSLALRRGAEDLLVLDPGGLSLGLVPELDDSKSYDPYAFEKPGTSGPPSELSFVSAPDAAWHKTADGATGALAVAQGVSLGVTARVVDDGHFVLDLAPSVEPPTSEVAYFRLRARTTGGPREGFYGLGEWPDEVDHRGKLRPMQIEPDPDVESSTLENHVVVPLLVGTHGWGVFVESTRVGTFDVARKEADVVEITYAAGPRGTPLRVHLYAADHPLDVTRHYYATTGQARVPAPWALGPWIWRDENKDQAEVESDIERIVELDLPTSGIWIDRPYATAVNSFDFDVARFPDPGAAIKKANDAGMRVALWSTPYLEPAAEPLRGEAVAKGYFPPGSGLALNKWSAPIDFTNPSAVAFWQALVSRYTGLGVEGFKLDYGEDVAPSLGAARNRWLFFDGSDERTMHHGYQLLYHRTYADALPRDAFLLCRAARWGDQVNVSVIWPGDMDATFTRHREPFRTRAGGEVVGVGGLPATVAMGLSLGASGFPFFGADTGGYRHSPPDEELFIRWSQQTALSSVMQVGDSSSQPPWVFTPENGRTKSTVDVYRTYARLHTRLFPYAWTFATRIKDDGRPLQRALGLAYPELGVHPSDTYMFGDDLLVAPVVTRGARTRRVALPPGGWVDYWTGRGVSPGPDGTAEVDAPLERLPLLVRAGALVPLLRPTIDTIAPATRADVDSFARDPGRLWVRAFAGPARRFDVYDGTRLERLDDGALRVTEGQVFRGVMAELVGAREPATVEVDGRAIARAAKREALDAMAEGWAWEALGGGTLWVAVASAPSSTVRAR